MQILFYLQSPDALQTPYDQERFAGREDACVAEGWRRDDLGLTEVLERVEVRGVRLEKLFTKFSAWFGKNINKLVNKTGLNKTIVNKLKSCTSVGINDLHKSLRVMLVSVKTVTNYQMLNEDR